MSTDIEKYLKGNRDELDVEYPDDTIIWEGIRSGIRKDNTAVPGESGKNFLMRIRNIAAIALIALLAGYVINDIVKENSVNRRITLASIDSDLARKEKEYKRLIKYKKQEIGSFKDIDNIIITELIEEMNRLDTIYNTVMDDLNNYGYNEKIVNTIFDTYEKKIRILELIILETNKPENNENRKDIAL